MTNLKLQGGGEVLLTTSTSDGENYVATIEDGATNVSKLESDVVGWNIEVESNFCRIDPQRMLILGYNAAARKAPYDDFDRPRRVKFPDKRYLTDHARRYRYVMKMLGESNEEKRKPSNIPIALPGINLPTDYDFIRAGSRGRRYGNAEEQHEIYFRDTDDDSKRLSKKGKMIFKSTGGPKGETLNATLFIYKLENGKQYTRVD